jgi:hypothetical protein
VRPDERGAGIGFTLRLIENVCDWGRQHARPRHAP